MSPSTGLLRLTAALLIGAAATLAAQNGPLDYPQWRGRTRDGSASGFAEPARWPEALTRRWKVTVGEGYATPIVVGARVYVCTRIDGNEGVTALDADSGARIWRTDYAAPYTPASPAAAHGPGPKATPLFYEDKIFALGISGIVAAFDATTGQLLWRTPAPAEAPFYGAASSPLGYAGRIVVHPGNYGPLTAFDSATGEKKWTAGGGGFFSSPILATLDGTPQFVTATQDSVIGVSAPDGQVLWKFPWSGGNGATTPVRYEATIIIASPEGMAAFRPTKRNEGWTVETLWSIKDVTMYLSNPVVVNGTVFGLSTKASGQYFAVDARTGKVLWLGQPRTATNTAVVKAGDLLFLLNNNAELVVAKASGTQFDPVKRYTVADSETWAQPAISGNRIFVKDATTLALWTVGER